MLPSLMYSSFELILLGVAALLGKFSGLSSLGLSKVAGPIVNSGTLGRLTFPFSFEIDLFTFSPCSA